MYKSCNLIQHGLCFFSDILTSCCFSPVDQVNGQIPPLIKKDYNGEVIPLDELFRHIDKYNDVFKSGMCPKECKNCYKIEEKDWEDRRYIDQITISHFSKCNADCVYCSNNLAPNERQADTYSIMPILKAYKEWGIIGKDAEFHIGGGEFTIYKECDELLEWFTANNFFRISVPTNAIKYSQALFKALNETNTYIIVSLDCGSRSTYKKIKRIDAFDRVIDNLKKYGATKKSREAIRLKYIIVPTFNDNMREFKKFLKIAKDLEAKYIILDIDARYSRINNYKIDDYYINLAYKMNDFAVKNNFVVEFYCFFLHDINARKIKKSNILIDFIKSIKFKYFDKKLKSIYQNHHYSDARKFE